VGPEDLDEMSYSSCTTRRFGVVGLGNIGRWIAKIVHHGFGANVIFYDYAGDPADCLRAHPARAVSLEELMSTSDIVALSLPSIRSPNKIIAASRLALMNAAQRSRERRPRRRSVDQDALIECLRERSHRRRGTRRLHERPLDKKSELAVALEQGRSARLTWRASAGENVERRIRHRFWRNVEAGLAEAGIPNGVVNDHQTRATNANRVTPERRRGLTTDI
jgi:lactate dehydrogenase-like 2-hydroxyacid dehydrogenase